MNRRENIAKRVGAGVKALDAHDPTWREEVHPEQLAMRDVCGCVLGQWAGTFTAGLRELMADEWAEGDYEAWAAEHGFEVSAEDPEWDVAKEYAMLEEAWIEVLK